MRAGAVFFLALLLAVPALADSGVALTAEGRQGGRIAFAADAVVVDEQPMAVDDLHGIVIQRSRASDTAPHAVQLRNGERWIVKIDSLDRGKLVVSSPLVGRRTLSVDAVQSITLSKPSDDGPTQVAKPGALTRVTGEPIPGALLWIDQQQVAIDSPLGVVLLPREQVVTYRFPKGDEPTAEPTSDALWLIDGTLLRGRVKLGDAAVAIKHQTFGRIRFPQPAVRKIRFARPDVTWLDPSMTDARAIDVFGRPIDQPVQSHDVPTALIAWRTPAHADLDLTLPGPDKPPTLHGRLRVEADPGVQLQVTLATDGKQLLARTITVGEPLDLSLDLADAAAVQLAVRPGDRFALPVHLVMEDLRLVR